jgi:hypothetical protein
VRPENYRVEHSYASGSLVAPDRGKDVLLAIEDMFDTGLPRAYDKPLNQQKCSALFEHLYESVTGHLVMPSSA